jgi:nitrous oxidase accessory protein NosD
VTGLRRRLTRAAGAVVVAVLVTLVGAPAVHAQDADDSGVVDAEDAQRQASLLAVEDRRIIEIRTVTSLARWQGEAWNTPYRLGMPTGFTLVLTPRSAPYTIEDLLELGPQTFLRMNDGSFLLAEHVIVVPGATLQLSRPGGLDLRLASGPDGFATIVSLGGTIELVGEESAPVRIIGWDVAAGAPDEELTDGRAYVRAIGGQFVARYAELSTLGFWSGRTGGLALTGTDRPDSGAIVSASPAGEAGPPTLLDDVTVQPAGPLESGQDPYGLGLTVPENNWVSSSIQHLTVSGNAFGLFVSGANGIEVVDSTFTDNQLGGVIFHRYVTNGSITRTTSSSNGGNGFTLARATTGIVISESTAVGNAGSGFRLDGRPLAEEPSAVGASLRSYGNNSLSNSTATDNGRFGVEVVGGFNVGVQNNRVEGHDMGIWVSGPSERISVVGNTVADSERHGIALVNGVAEATVTGNVVDGSSTGVYLRDSVGVVSGNTVQDARSHGVSFVGNVRGSDVSYNVLAGSGSSALDTHRSSGGVSSTTNNTDGWHDTTGWVVIFKKLLQPMTALWSALALLIVVSAVRGRRGDRPIEHPYARQAATFDALPAAPPLVIDLDGRPALQLAGREG